MTTRVLGINNYSHDSSVAVIEDGRVVFAVAEERLSRIRKDRSFPKLSIAAALADRGVALQDLDAVAFGWNKPPATQIHTLLTSLRGQVPRSASFIGHSLFGIPREMHNGIGRKSLEYYFGPANPVYIDHHEAHAWSAYALSGFDESTVVVMDGRGARQATTVYHAEGQALRRIKQINYPNSLGSFYEAFTDLLGFERHSDEWKVMGLAAYGEPVVDLSNVIKIGRDGYRINAPLLIGRSWGDIAAMEREFGPRRNPERLTQADRDLAASVQHALEQAVFAVVRGAIAATGCRKVCLAGGVAMNSKANGRLLASGMVDDLFVQPAATDDGTAVGAALAAHRSLGLEVPRYRQTEAYWGPGFTKAEIEAALRTFKLRAFEVPDIERQAAQLLADGHVIGWFQGRMEFGPRALGNRSILADARRPEMKDRVNEAVKFREGWRPFAPSCLAEHAGEFFAGCTDAPYMILCFDVLPDAAPRIPAVTHADGTARVQTVTRDTNPRYWELIRQFAAITGVPVIMNTSFNLRGEPIVCTPRDAVRTFYSSGLDFLVLGEHIIAKDPNWRPSLAPELAAVG